MANPIVFADDLTGAAEMGAFVATDGSPARVVWEAEPPRASGPRSLVVDTESRNLAPEAARERLRPALERLARGPDGVVYKKIDSTLRGPIRPELELLLEATRLGPVVLAPAYPLMGRTTSAGVQYLDGTPVAEGPAGTDPLAPAHVSDLRRMLPGEAVVLPAPGGGGGGEVGTALRRHLDEGRHVVADARTERDLEVLARALHEVGPNLIVGSGGLARHLWPRPDVVQLATDSGAIAVVVGSDHPSARAQVDHLCTTHRCRRLVGPDPRPLPEHGIDVLVLTTPATRAAPAVALRDLGGAFEEVMAAGRPSALIVTGGETALHVLRRLNASAFDIVGELVEGVPVGRIVGGPWADLILATKAGGFGSPELLAHAVARLRPASENVS